MYGGTLSSNDATQSLLLLGCYGVSSAITEKFSQPNQETKEWEKTLDFLKMENIPGAKRYYNDNDPFLTWMKIDLIVSLVFDVKHTDNRILTVKWGGLDFERLPIIQYYRSCGVHEIKEIVEKINADFSNFFKPFIGTRIYINSHAEMLANFEYIIPTKNAGKRAEA